MPIYEYECDACTWRFEELVPSGADTLPCPRCGSRQTRRRLSTVAPPGRLPQGPSVRDSEARRREREAARAERLAETKRKRAAGELPPRRAGKGGG